MTGWQRGSDGMAEGRWGMGLACGGVAVRSLGHAFGVEGMWTSSVQL